MLMFLKWVINRLKRELSNFSLDLSLDEYSLECIKETAEFFYIVFICTYGIKVLVWGVVFGTVGLLVTSIGLVISLITNKMIILFVQYKKEVNKLLTEL